MRNALVRRAATLAGALLLSLFLIVHPAPASAAASGSWGTSDGGAVAVKADGSYDMAFTDAETGQSVFSTGRVVSRQTTSDGKVEMTLKPIGGGTTTYVIEVDPDGNGTLYAVEGGARHKAADLTK